MPSRGRAPFANLFSRTFPASQCTAPGIEYAVWNTNIINSLDIVPQVWCMKPEDSPSQNLDNVSPIYGSPVLPIIEWGIAFLRVKANLVDTVYMPLQSRIISGAVLPQREECRSFCVRQRRTTSHFIPTYLESTARNVIVYS